MSDEQKPFDPSDPNRVYNVKVGELTAEKIKEAMKGKDALLLSKALIGILRTVDYPISENEGIAGLMWLALTIVLGAGCSVKDLQDTVDIFVGIMDREVGDRVLREVQNRPEDFADVRRKQAMKAFDQLMNGGFDGKLN